MVAVIQEFAYDWTHRYAVDAEYRIITGYMKTKVEKESANAFHTRRLQNGQVEIVWKVRVTILNGLDTTANQWLTSTIIPGHPDS